MPLFDAQIHVLVGSELKVRAQELADSDERSLGWFVRAAIAEKIQRDGGGLTALKAMANAPSQSAASSIAQAALAELSSQGDT